MWCALGPAHIKRSNHALCAFWTTGIRLRNCACDCSLSATHFCTHALWFTGTPNTTTPRSSSGPSPVHASAPMESRPSGLMPALFHTLVFPMLTSMPADLKSDCLTWRPRKPFVGLLFVSRSSPQASHFCSRGTPTFGSPFSSSVVHNRPLLTIVQEILQSHSLVFRNPPISHPPLWCRSGQYSLFTFPSRLRHCSLWFQLLFTCVSLLLTTFFRPRAVLLSS